MTERNQQKYGEIMLLNKRIVCTIDGKIIFEIPIDEIKIIGEFTTTDGQFVDDWFLTFITKKEWHEVTMNLNGIDELLLDLGNGLNSKLDYQLANSSAWKTRIIYPENLREKELYDIIGSKPKTFIKKILGIRKSSREFSKEVKNLLNA